MIIGPEPLSETQSTDEFDCGRTSLNFFIKRQALQGQADGNTRTYVIHLDDLVIGYYSVCPSGLSRKLAITDVLKGRSKFDPIPGVLIARLAVSQAYQGIGLGKALLKDALLRSLNAAEQIGGRVIFVHALDDSARVFYEHFGFESSPIDANVLMLLIQDAKAAVGA